MLNGYPILHYKSKLFANIAVSGLVALNAERNFKLLRDIKLTILQNNVLLLSIESKTQFLKQIFDIVSNNLGFTVQINNQKSIAIDGKTYTFNINKLYLLQKKYADVLIDGNEVGSLQFTQKFPNFHLDFYQNNEFNLNTDKIMKLAIATLINIADLDGSE